VRYQAALRPEPLGSNTRTIASQPTTVRGAILFIDFFSCNPLRRARESLWITIVVDSGRAHRE
jgi:hypothetical protein